jgi:hypothetical protein
VFLLEFKDAQRPAYNSPTTNYSEEEPPLELRGARTRAKLCRHLSRASLCAEVMRRSSGVATEVLEV